MKQPATIPAPLPDKRTEYEKIDNAIGRLADVFRQKLRHTSPKIEFTAQQNGELNLILRGAYGLGYSRARFDHQNHLEHEVPEGVEPERWPSEKDPTPIDNWNREPIQIGKLVDDVIARIPTKKDKK